MLNNLNNIIKHQIDQSIEVKKTLNINDIYSAAVILVEALKNNNKILLCGNGGSAADCQHIAAELVVRFRSSIKRNSLPAIALTTDTSILTAGGNDLGFDNIFSQQIMGLGNKGDVLLAISTSGNSKNVINAVKVAREKHIKCIGLLGCNGGILSSLCDLSIIVNSIETARIQESHLLIEHILCDLIERILFPELFKN